MRNDTAAGERATETGTSRGVQVVVRTAFDDTVLAAADALQAFRCTPSLHELQAFAQAHTQLAVRIVLVRAEGEWVGLSACFTSRDRVHGMRLQTYRLLGCRMYDYNALLYRPGFLPHLLNAMQCDARSLHCDAVVLDNMAEELAPLQRHAGRLSERLKIVRLDTADAPGNAILAKKSFKRDAGYFRKQAGYLVEHRFGDFTVDDLRPLAELHVERWAFDGVASQFATNSGRAGEYCAHPQNKLLTFISVDGDLVACHYGMVFGDTLVFHTPVVNVKYLDRSPMKTLLYELAGWCAEHSIRTLDLGLGDESYKESVANAERSVHSYFLPTSSRGFACLAMRRAVHTGGLKERLQRLRAHLVTLAGNTSRILHPVTFYSASLAPQAPPTCTRLKKAGSYSEYVELARSLQLKPSRLGFERYREGNTFAALLHEDGGLLATAWLNASGSFHASDVNRDLQNPGGVCVFDLAPQGRWPLPECSAALLKHLASAFPHVLIHSRGPVRALQAALAASGLHLVPTPAAQPRNA